MKNCEHAIGFICDYGNSDIITLEELKERIESMKELCEKEYIFKYYTLSDYCDFRKSVDIQRFNYCPFCGEKIEWKSIAKAK